MGRLPQTGGSPGLHVPLRSLCSHVSSTQHSTSYVVGTQWLFAEFPLRRKCIQSALPAIWHRAKHLRNGSFWYHSSAHENASIWSSSKTICAPYLLPLLSEPTVSPSSWDGTVWARGHKLSHAHGHWGCFFMGVAVHLLLPL